MLHFIVTGGCGFIGGHLVRKLVEEFEVSITVVDDQRQGKYIVNHPDVTYVLKNVCDYWPARHYDGIIHLANTPRIRMSLEEPKESIENNLMPTLQVMEWARALSTPVYFACSSSTKFSGEFNNPYTFGKRVCEGLLHLYGIHYGVKYYYMFFYNVYGPGEADYGEHSTVIRAFKKKFLAGEPLRIYGTGRKTRDFTHVDDVTSGIIKLLQEKKKPGVIHLGAGYPYSINDIAEAFDHPAINEFDKPGESQHTQCDNPYVLAKHNVIDYIKDWVKRNGNAKASN